MGWKRSRSSGVANRDRPPNGRITAVCARGSGRGQAWHSGVAKSRSLMADRHATNGVPPTPISGAQDCRPKPPTTIATRRPRRPPSRRRRAAEERQNAPFRLDEPRNEAAFHQRCNLIAVASQRAAMTPAVSETVRAMLTPRPPKSPLGLRQHSQGTDRADEELWGAAGARQRCDIIGVLPGDAGMG